MKGQLCKGLYRRNTDSGQQIGSLILRDYYIKMAGRRYFLETNTYFSLTGESFSRPESISQRSNTTPSPLPEESRPFSLTVPRKELDESYVYILHA